MKQCEICGAQTPHNYTAYIDNTQKAKPDNKYLTGKTQILSMRSGQKSTYLEYDIPVCRKCVYVSQIRFNVIAALISGAIGATVFFLLSAKIWGSLVFVFCFGNVVFGISQLMKYLSDGPNEGGAISALSDYYNKGFPSGSRAAWYSGEKLRSDIGKLGALTQGQLPGVAVPGSEGVIVMKNERYCNACHRTDLKLYYSERPDPARDAISLRCARCGGTICQHCRGKLARHSNMDRDGQLCPVCGQYTIYDYTGKNDYSDILRQAEMRYGPTKR